MKEWVSKMFFEPKCAIQSRVINIKNMKTCEDLVMKSFNLPLPLVEKPKSAAPYCLSAHGFGSCFHSCRQLDSQPCNQLSMSATFLKTLRPIEVFLVLSYFPPLFHHVNPPHWFSVLLRVDSVLTRKRKMLKFPLEKSV